MSSSLQHLDWWSSLRHGGMLLDAPRLSQLLKEHDCQPLTNNEQDRLRRNLAAYIDDPDGQRGEFVKYMLESVCRLARSTGEWYRGSEVSASWSRPSITGDTIRPQHLWIGKRDAVLPVFIDKEKRIGMGRGVRVVSNALQWMRKTGNRLGLVTNGEQWRILFAGLSYEAFAEWDHRQWLAAGEPTPELNGFRQLLSPDVLTPETAGESSPFIEAINDSRKGQAELSEVLGERVRTAAELLIQGQTAALQSHFAGGDFTAQELYRAAVRIIMRLVVVLFSESREALLPRDNPIYFNSYSLGGLREQLERIHVGRLRNSYAAYPRIMSLFRLIYEGSSHESLLVRAYGGQLFAPGNAEAPDGMARALHALENGCYENDVMNDQQVHQILDLLSRTKIRIRQGRQSTWVAAPVDFSSLDSEYIGILYEGLLDFELRQAGTGEPVIFLAVGNQPALPLATLEAMDDKSLKNLLEKMKDTSSAADDSDDEAAEDDAADDADSEAAGDDSDEAESDSDDLDDDNADEASDDQADDNAEPDERLTARTRAENWARRAIEVGKLVTKPRGTLTDERKQQYAAAIDRKARQIITKVVLPGEWYLVRWGGTRKGSGTFYTKPQLAIPTVARTLQPLVYESRDTTGDSQPPELSDGEVVAELHGEYIQSGKTAKRSHALTQKVDVTAFHPAADSGHEIVPKPPEHILALKVCDPACGSGTFPLNALRYLTEALYESLHYYKRIQYYADRTVIDLITVPLPPIDHQPPTTAPQPLRYRTLAGELLPCRPEDNDFEARTKAVLRRYIVERCIYGVDLDPLAVELCRLSLWIETLDPRLPFTFLDHKIKCGNALIGTWFDQFMHYPAMAWMREGGDKAHSGGVHFEKEAWTKLISGQKGDVQKQLIDYIDQQLYLNTGEDLDTVKTVHDDAEKALARIHNMGVHEAEQRARAYHALRESQEFQDAKFSLDLWNAIWFWPPEHIEHCPLPTDFYQGQLSAAAQQIVRDLANNWRFFHWQLEFPDVFSTSDDGFDAVLGNPPWDIAKPNSKEFFSALDPLYRSYGKQEALNKQKEYFDQDIETERRWLIYNAQFRAQSNWVKNSGGPYGNTVNTDSKGKQSQELNLGGGGGGSFDRSGRRHEKWKDNREGMSGYSQSLEDERGFHHQGGGDINLYKMFLEQAHAILRPAGRLGFIVPSGLYSDHGTGALRTLFLERCRWQWLFGFENREGIFDIHRSFKFNPVIIEKGGTTDVIQTAFMRRDLADWERAEKFVTRYPRERVLQFSPRSKAILEIQSQRDLEVLEKIYSNSVLLGDDGPNGWGIKYATEFHMTNDSKLFPPRDQWEARGYRPDEYSRWLKGNWRPIEELVVSGLCSVTGTSDHQPPTTNDDSSDRQSPSTATYRRADIPAGIILSRDGQSWISEDEIDTDEFKDKKGNKQYAKAIALPFVQGVMLHQYDFSYKRWVSGTGLLAKWDPIEWEHKTISPQYLMASKFAPKRQAKSLHRRVARNTDTRMMISSISPGLPSGDKSPVLHCKAYGDNFALTAVLNSFVFDSLLRNRCGATNIDLTSLQALPIPVDQPARDAMAQIVLRMNCGSIVFAPEWLKLFPGTVKSTWKSYWSITHRRRLELTVAANVIAALCSGLNYADFAEILKDCDWPIDALAVSSPSNSKGLWRIDKAIPPEHRLTVLSLVSFADIVRDSTNKLDEDIQSFLSQNDGEGWQLPETLRLADYGLGHDDRAREHQPVRECFGPRFYDWQLEQDPEESWRECHLHARNLLGPTAYQALLDELASGQGSVTSRQSPTVREEASKFQTNNQQSPATDHQPPAADHQPPPAGHRSPTTANAPPPDPNDFTLSAEPAKKQSKAKQ